MRNRRGDRQRRRSVSWRLGDVVNSTPTIVGAPRERFDILYGDSGYRKFVSRWANRRQNGLCRRKRRNAPCVQCRATTTEEMIHRRAASWSMAGIHEPRYPIIRAGPGWVKKCGDSCPIISFRNSVGTRKADYTHVSYVDLKPKVTDARIFHAGSGVRRRNDPTAAGCIHPDGWGTILIGGLRFGGSCGSCAAVSGGNNGGPALQVVADFNGNGNTTDVNDTSYFYSAYFVLDITDPDATPTVIGVYSASDLGLTTSYPAVVRMNLSSDGNTTHTNSKWFMVLGSGVHGYDGRAAAAGKVFAVEFRICTRISSCYHTSRDRHLEFVHGRSYCLGP